MSYPKVTLNLLSSIILLVIFHQGQLSAQSFDEVKTKAVSGNLEAMVKLSEYFTLGIGVTSNDDSAFYWVKKAATSGHTGAKFIVGSTLTAKVYSEKEFAEGMKWLKEAADSHQTQALMNLHSIYLSKGTGTEADKFYNTAKAWRCLYLADSLGERNATMGCAEALLKGKIVKQNDSLAVVYFRKAVEKFNLPRAQIRLGDMYYLGKVNHTMQVFNAFYWYMEAYKNPKSTIDDQADADVAMHKVDQAIKQTHNLMMQGNFFLPPGSFEYKLRRM